MKKTHAVGIDLGTTYSCIAYLNEHGEPVTLPNQEGELSTPSVVLIEDGEIVVGTEALRNAIANPAHVVQNSKRYMGSPHRWTIDGSAYTPVDIAALILRKLLDGAQERIGPIEQAVITVPAQFSDVQREATIRAGIQAGLKHVTIINEPVAAALCYVLGTEGLWFTELADDQRILVYDLGGGTFDLSLVQYTRNEVSVLASSGDLQLGGIDWNRALQQHVCMLFAREFQTDPREDPKSLQFLALEVENAKRSLSVRSRAALTCQHAGHRKTYQIEQANFEELTHELVERTIDITQRLLKDNGMGWAHVDVVLATGGASRMPMIRKALKAVSGTTLNTSLSPDQSIAHGAAFYAGMLLTNSEFAKSILRKEVRERLARIRQRSVNARSLGILVRDKRHNRRVPFYLIPANTPLPVAATKTFGTVVPNQKRVHLQIIESGTAPDQPYVKLGSCIIDHLTPNLPEGSKIDVTIQYDDQARVHVSARDLTGGRQATAQIVREENLLVLPVEASEAAPVLSPGSAPKSAAAKTAAAAETSAPKRQPATPAGKASTASGRKRISPRARPAAESPPSSTPKPAATP
ncbi:MAG: Hsp70 family protein, partial [Planctomycetes bacterium]|nr:Hsp70 family protein [Planctomycetota bacterium]